MAYPTVSAPYGLEPINRVDGMPYAGAIRQIPSAAGYATAILNGATVLGQGFNIGSYQRNCRVGIDWLESSLINGGDRVEFGVIPAPGAIALLGTAGLMGRRRRN